MHRATRQFWLWVAAAAAAIIVGVGSVLLLQAPSEVFLQPAEGNEDQVVFQQKAARDRTALFTGALTYLPLDSVDVGNSVEFSATLAGPEAEAEVPNPDDTLPALPDPFRSSDYPDLNPSPNPSPREEPEETEETRELPVGGVQAAHLSEPSGDVKVDPIGSVRQLLASRRDKVEWRWNLTPRKPGRYQLSLVVETYQGDTENVLARTAPPIHIDMTVNKTFWYRVGEAKEWIIAAGAVLAALGVIFSPLRTTLVRFVSGRIGSGRRASER
ncbi:hypothetical protein PV721_35820 [Streptomyces sp. MB09-01]|uniref:hypothetical protein n=1 Tax=Streptomyces sp. MB09-01 TaxID=3028666 RepID=UPI0029A030AE|nr:hypothetical protein [Streptomyces sp. MB09-01]MDX3539604.1 hypothetical protein [Streptomyces sp. MB09-01]